MLAFERGFYSKRDPKAWPLSGFPFESSGDERILFWHRGHVRPTDLGQGNSGGSVGESKFHEGFSFLSQTDATAAWQFGRPACGLCPFGKASEPPH